MILSKLKLKNFKKYKEYELLFEDGLVGIIGKNGSGKSTIFDAIFFALYGELKSKGAKELVRNVNANEKDIVSVELEFEFDNVHYVIIREFRGKNLTATAKLMKLDDLICTGAKEVTKAVIQLTRMSKDAFMHTLFASQKELTSLSSLDNEHRKKMIRKLLGLEKIDLIEKFLKESITELNRDIKSFSSLLLTIEQLDEKQDQIDTHKKALEQLRIIMQEQNRKLEEIKKKELTLGNRLVELDKTKDQKLSVENRLKIESSKLDSVKQKSVELQKELALLEEKALEYEKLKDVKSQYKALQEKLEEQEKLKEFHLKKVGLVKERDELRLAYKKQKDEITKLEEETSTIEVVENKAKEIKEHLEILQKRLRDKKISERELRDKIAGETNLIKDTKNKIQTIKALGKESKCPTCTRDLLDDYDSVLESLHSLCEQNYEKNIVVYEKQLKDLEERIELRQEEYDKLLEEEKQNHSRLNIIKEKKKDLVKVKAYLSDIEVRGKSNNDQIEKLEAYTYDEKIYQNLIVQSQELKQKYEYVLSLETMLQRRQIITKGIKETKEQIELIIQSIKEQDIQLQNIKYDEKEHQNIKEQSSKTTKSKEDMVELLHNKKLEESKIKGEINTINHILEENERQKSKLDSKIADLDDYTKLRVSMGEFKTNINSKVAPKISQIASDMYSKITKGKYQYIEVSNDFDFFIYDDGKKYPIERFSGGEVDLANLVLRIAISKTLGELNGSSQMGFLAFDEVFGSQDEARRLEILEAFHTIKEQYRQIFLISHEMEIKEMFERVVEL